MSIVCIGELLIDFISQDIDSNLANSNLFLKKAGGAPANVAAVVSRLGGQGLFCGKVGQDGFGDFLESSLVEHGVDISLLTRDEEKATTLAFVSLQADGERDFSFVRGADANLAIEDIDISKVEECSIVHFGSATGLLDGKLKETYKELFDYSYDKGKFISFDPNYRGAFWQGLENKFTEESMYFIKKSDFLKVSEEELHILSGKDNIDEGVMYLHEVGAKIIAVTLGSKGTYISTGNTKKTIPSIKVKSIDSTGAGDAFVGALLYYFEENNLILSDFAVIEACVEKANKIAAMVCTKMGAMEALDIIGK